MKNVLLFDKPSGRLVRISKDKMAVYIGKGYSYIKNKTVYKYEVFDYKEENK